MRKGLIHRILNPIKYIIMCIRGEIYKDPKTGMVFIPTEAEIDIYHNDGAKYFNKGKYAKAIEMFKKEIEYDPNGFCGYRSLGNVFNKIGDKHKAKKNYEIALKNAKTMLARNPKSIDKSIMKEIEESLFSLQ